MAYAPRTGKVTEAQYEAAKQWVLANVGASAAGSFHDVLKNGVFLAQLVKKINPGSITDRSLGPQKKSIEGPFGKNEARERIGEVIKAFRKIEVPERYLFNPNDLLEAHNLEAVYIALCQLSNRCEKLGLTMKGTAIHIRETEKRASTMTEAKKRAAAAAIPKMATLTKTIDSGEHVDSHGVIMHSTVKR